MPSRFQSRTEMVSAISVRIEAYNKSPRGNSYNKHYDEFIQVRLAGLRNYGLADWLKTSEAVFAIRFLLQGNDLETFLALDRSNGATGIPRLLDKVLW